MIKAHEIRIGSLVSVKPVQGKIALVRVTTVCEDGAEVNGLIVEEEYLHPIPLTEDWLIKLGFTKTAANLNEDPADDITYYDKQHGRHTLRFSYQFGDYLIQFEHDLCDFHVIGDENTVAYIHQVQNLFFSLCGTELSVL